MSSPQDMKKGDPKEFQAAEPSAPLDYSTLGGDEQEKSNDEDSKHPGTATKGGEHEGKVPTAPPAPFGDLNMKPGKIEDNKHGATVKPCTHMHKKLTYEYSSNPL